MDTISLYIFPDREKSILNFYEDDGISFKYLKGERTITRISALEQGKESIIEIGLPKGNFKDEVKNRRWNIIMHFDSKPTSVESNDKPILNNTYSWNGSRKELTINGIVAPSKILVKK